MKNENSELDSYDQIGMQYFYIGRIASASYYHGRMMEGRIEPLMSSIRINHHRIERKLKDDVYRAVNLQSLRNKFKIKVMEKINKISTERSDASRFGKEYNASSKIKIAVIEHLIIEIHYNRKSDRK